MHGRGIEERALPGGPVLDGDAAACTGRRPRRPQTPPRRSAGSAPCAPRRAGPRTVSSRLRRSPRLAGGPVRSPRHAHRATRHASHQSPEEAASDLPRLARPQQRRDEQQHVDDDVPCEEREHRRGEQVDARARTDAVECHAGQERDDDDRRADPLAPAQGLDGAVSARWRVPMRSSASFARRATKSSTDAALADDLGSRTARPGAVGVAPQRARAIGRLDRADGGDLEGVRFFHRVDRGSTQLYAGCVALPAGVGGRGARRRVADRVGRREHAFAGAQCFGEMPGNQRNNARSP